MISKYKNIKYSFKTLIYFFVFTILGRLLLLFKDKKKNSKVIKNILIVGRGRSYFKILNNKSFLKKLIQFVWLILALRMEVSLQKKY